MKLNVKQIAKLANLNLSEDEITQFEPQLAETLEYIDHLNEVDTNNIEPTNHVTGLENVTRPDEAKKSLTQDQALANAKSVLKGYFQVKGIFTDE